MSSRDAVSTVQPALQQLRIPRMLPIPGRVLVQVGDLVRPNSVVARADLSPSNRWAIPVAKQLGISSACLATHLLVIPGERVMLDQVLARVNGQVRSGRECRAPINGVLEEVIEATGQLILREEASAVLPPVVIAAADYLQCKPKQLPDFVWKTKGERVQHGEVLAMILPGRVLTSPVSGQLADLDLKTGEITITQAMDQMALEAAVDGVIAQIEPAWGCTVQCQAWVVGGKLQLGSETYGRLQLVTSTEQGVVSDKEITTEMTGRVLVVGAMFTAEAYWKARAIGVKAIISGGAHLRDLLPAMGDLHSGPAISNMAVFLTEGFGCLPMRREIFGLLQSQEGRSASVISQQPSLPPQMLIFPPR